jgi:hypothetical protein
VSVRLGGVPIASRGWIAPAVICGGRTVSNDDLDDLKPNEARPLEDELLGDMGPLADERMTSALPSISHSTYW